MPKTTFHRVTGAWRSETGEFFLHAGINFQAEEARQAQRGANVWIFRPPLGPKLGVAYGFCLMRAPKFVPVLIAVHVASALAVPKHLGSFAIDWARVASTAAGVDEIGSIFAILLGYIFFIRFIKNQGLHYFRVLSTSA